MNRLVWALGVFLSIALTGCEKSTLKSDMPVQAGNWFEKLPDLTLQPYSDVTIVGNGTITEAEYGVIQKAVSEYHTTCLPTETTTGPSPEMYYSPFIFQILVEDRDNVTVITSFYAGLLGSGNIIELKRKGNDWIVLNVAQWAK